MSVCYLLVFAAATSVTSCSLRSIISCSVHLQFRYLSIMYAVVSSSICLPVAKEEIREK